MFRDDLDALMMLLDGGLDPKDEAMLRARIEDEPELAAQWRELSALQKHLRSELSGQLPANFTADVMAKVRQTDQVPAGLLQRFQTWLSRPIALPVAAAAALLIMWAVGLPQPAPPPQLEPPAVAATPSTNGQHMAAGETEIESIDNQTNYNVLVLAAPGSPNRLIWLSQRTMNDEG